MTDRGRVTQILHRMGEGDRGAFDDLFPLIYRELRAVAAKYMGRERAGQTLQATALTHEAYLRLLGEGITDVNDRAHFFAVAARAMRQILIERARAKKAKKRGGDLQRITLLPDIADDSTPDLDVLALEEALVKLTGSHPRKA